MINKPDPMDHRSNINKTHHKLYIWGNSPLKNSTYDKLKKIYLKKNIENNLEANILCFCNEEKSNAFKESIKSIPIATTIFNEKEISTKEILNFNYFYFPSYNRYKKLKKFLEKNKIKEPKHYDIGYKFYPPFNIFFKYHDYYLKFLKINKGNEDSEDESIYTDFLGCYEYDKELFDNPYITYHPGGILDFKTLSKKKLLTDKIYSLKFNDIKENKIFEIFSIEISPTIFNKLEKISANDIKKLEKRNWIYLVEVGQNFKEIIELEVDKETFIMFDINIKKNLNLCFYINKTIDKEVLEKLCNGNYVSMYFLNSDLYLTIFLKEDNVKTKNGIQDLKIFMGEKSFNLKLAKDLGKDNKND